jgi:hypothetical protein
MSSAGNRVSVATLVIVLASAGPAGAQTPAAPRPFAVFDNSFLIEEAFNQEPGTFQNIFSYMRAGRNWELMFTQEWPMAGLKNQFSYAIPVLNPGTGAGIGDILINYRYQLMFESHRAPAIAPRLSLVLPTGSFAEARGSGTPGIQVNVPMSKQAGNVYLHANAGLTWLPSVEAPAQPDRVSLTSPFVGASVNWRAWPMVHPMLEVLATWEQMADVAGRVREREVIVSPGVRAGWNFGDRQFVLGLAAPVSFTAGARDVAGLLYLSYELPFRR